MILNAFIDDSYDESVFVLAGYVAPADEWAAFSVEWKAELEAHPKLWHLKTSDAMRLQSQFYRWASQDRDAKLSRLYAIIDEHVSFEVSCAIPMEPFNRIIVASDLPPAAKDPFYMAISGLMGGVVREQIRQGMPERIDFVFDEQVMKQGRFLAIWDQLVASQPAEIQAMIGSTPIFRSDADVLPLQAADLEAWWVRRRWQEQERGIARLEYPWQPAAIPGVAVTFLEADLLRSRDQIRDAHLAVGWRPGDGNRVG